MTGRCRPFWSQHFLEKNIMLLRLAFRRIIAGILVLFAITYVAYFTQDIAARQRALQPAPAGEVAVQAWGQTLDVWKGISRGDLGHTRAARARALHKGSCCR